MTLKSRGVSKSTRRRILVRDNFTCAYCKRIFAVRRLHVDHVHSVSTGGASDDENLVTACARCNMSKGSKPLSRWSADHVGYQVRRAAHFARMKRVPNLPPSEPLPALPKSLQPAPSREMLLKALTNLAKIRQQAPTVPTEAKILLTLDEAKALTGLSRETLRTAIKAGKLKAQFIGRGWKVKRVDLDSYIAKL